jgi:hypothetical protein
MQEAFEGSFVDLCWRHGRKFCWRYAKRRNLPGELLRYAMDARGVSPRRGSAMRGGRGPCERRRSAQKTRRERRGFASEKSNTWWGDLKTEGAPRTSRTKEPKLLRRWGEVRCEEDATVLEVRRKWIREVQSFSTRRPRQVGKILARVPPK